MRYAFVALFLLIAGCASAPNPHQVGPRIEVRTVRVPAPYPVTVSVACPTDAQVVAAVIVASKETYRRKSTNNRCPCAADVTPEGASCLGQSAEERPNGDRPFCQPADVAPYLPAFRAALPGIEKCGPREREG